MHVTAGYGVVDFLREEVQPPRPRVGLDLAIPGVLLGEAREGGREFGALLGGEFVEGFSDLGEGHGREGRARAQTVA